MAAEYQTVPPGCPIVHLNGTGREALITARCEAYTAIGAAGRALAAMAPNGRDYYPAGPAAFDAACQIHRRRVELLRDLLAEIQAEVNYLNGI